jgi:hypothetical protein
MTPFSSAPIRMASPEKSNHRDRHVASSEPGVIHTHRPGRFGAKW